MGLEMMFKVTTKTADVAEMRKEQIDIGREKNQMWKKKVKFKGNINITGDS